MKHTLLKSALVALLMTGGLNIAQAASVTLNANPGTITVGQTVSFDYDMDFTGESTTGGGTDFWYDSSLLQFQGWTYDSGYDSSDSVFHHAPTDCAVDGGSDAGCGFDATEFGPGLDQLNGMSFGNFGGLQGPMTIGQLVFLAVGEGVATVFMAANDDGVAGNPGPFSGANGQIAVDFNHGSVTIANQVPVPAAVWFMLSGLGMLGGFRRFG